MDHFRRDGLMFQVRDRGPGGGDPVVLLHGFPQTAAAWDGVEPLLHRAGLRTLSYDQRGYADGARPGGRRSYAIGEVGADVLALLDAAGAGRAHVVGHDWGGVLCWWLGARHPDRVRTLTVLSTPHPRALALASLTSAQLARSWYVALFQIPALPERLLGRRRGPMGLEAILRRSGLDPAHVEEYGRALSSPGALTAALNWYRALPFQRPTSVAARVGVPTRLVWGEQDQFLGRRAAEATGRFVDDDYRFVPLAGAGHWLPERHGGDVAAAVVEVTARHPC